MNKGTRSAPPDPLNELVLMMDSLAVGDTASVDEEPLMLTE